MSPTPRGCRTSPPPPPPPGIPPPGPPGGGGGGGGGGAKPPELSISSPLYLSAIGCIVSGVGAEGGRGPSDHSGPTSQPTGSSGKGQAGSATHLSHSWSKGGRRNSTCSTARSPQYLNHAASPCVNIPSATASSSSSSSFQLQLDRSGAINTSS